MTKAEHNAAITAAFQALEGALDAAFMDGHAMNFVVINRNTKRAMPFDFQQYVVGVILYDVVIPEAVPEGEALN